jgi:hypothetical protein
LYVKILALNLSELGQNVSHLPDGDGLLADGGAELGEVRHGHGGHILDDDEARDARLVSRVEGQLCDHERQADLVDQIELGGVEVARAQEENLAAVLVVPLER